MTLPREIEKLAHLGWRLYPASTSSKAACFKGATDAATKDLDQLDRWAAAYRDCNWRVVMQGSDIWGLDCDVPGGDHGADGVAALKILVDEHGALPNRPTTRSGGGGLALIFRHRGEPICGKTGWPAPGLDPRRGRHALTVPPSVHITTRQRYRWLVAPWDVAPSPAPPWLLRLVAPPPEPPLPGHASVPEPGSDRARAYALGALRRAVEQVATAREGSRNDVLNSATWSLVRFMPDSLGASEIADALAVAAVHAGLSRRETQATIASALRAGGRQ